MRKEWVVFFYIIKKYTWFYDVKLDLWYIGRFDISRTS
jgi:hypothetical protein